MGVQYSGNLRPLLRITLILFFAVLAANAAPVPPCEPQMLDVQVLPPLEPNTARRLHILVIELENRNASPCQLRGPQVQLLPESGADPFTNSFFINQERTPAEREFEQEHSVLGGGGSAHFLVAWNSHDPFESGCLNRDALSFYLEPNSPPVLAVEHLWAHVCDRAFISHYRVGRYVGEPIAREYLQRLDAQPGDFVPASLAEPSLQDKSSVVLETRSDREMLHDFVELFLELPIRADDCPFVVLRKREANGLSKAYINHCADVDLQETPRADLGHSQSNSILNLPALGLAPENIGTVEYTVFSRVPPDGKSIYAQAKTSIRVRDPQLPKLPPIDSPAPECEITQLSAVKLPTIAGGKWRDALIYNVTNISQKTCRLGGVPHLTFSHPVNKSYSAIPTPCPNCANPLFQPRPIGWIDLEPQGFAHFIVGASRFPQDSGPWRQICDVVENIDLKLPGDPQSISLPFGVGTCAQIDISAWRPGEYDGDPQNIHLAEPTSNLSTREVPTQCARKELSELGRPVMMRQDDRVAYGLSVAPSNIRFGNPIPLHLWINNQSDKEISVMTCMNLDFFWSEGFDVYDAYGHRLLKKNEIKHLGKVATSLSETQGKDCLATWMCGRNFPIQIPANTCANETMFQLPHDFSRDLSESYDLSPGLYYIVAADRFDQNLCRRTIPRLTPAALRGTLRFTVEQD